jgi:GDP-L-fucose synthase
MIHENSKILVTGHNGMVGSSVVRCLKNCGYRHIITVEKLSCDFIDQDDVRCFFTNNSFDAVVMCAARVGGIQFNIDNPARMIYENSMITLNTLEEAKNHNIKDLIFLGSSCIYPKESKGKLKESDLLTGSFEPTNEMYALSKSLGIKTIEAYNKQYGFNWTALQPCNLFGPNDNYDLKNSHFIPALIRKIHEAKEENKTEVILWGDGTPKREVLYVDDLSFAIEIVLRKGTPYSLLNVGSGLDFSIKHYFEFVKNIIGYKGKAVWDDSKPSGIKRKLMKSDKIKKLGWVPGITISEGLRRTYEDFKKSIQKDEETHSYKLSPKNY